VNERTYRVPDDELDTPPNQPTTRYSAHPGHPLARVPYGALLVARRYMWVDLHDVNWADLGDVESAADALVATLAMHGYLTLAHHERPRSRRNWRTWFTVINSVQLPRWLRRR
jgi:hypothetical protein